MPIDYAQWAGLFVARGDAGARCVAKLRDAARAAANDPKVQRGAGQVRQPDPLPGQRRTSSATSTSDAAKMTEVVKKIGKLE